MNALNAWLETFFRRGRHRGVYDRYIGDHFLWTSIRDAPQDLVRRELNLSIEIQPDLPGFSFATFDPSLEHTVEALNAEARRWHGIPAG